MTPTPTHLVGRHQPVLMLVLQLPPPTEAASRVRALVVSVTRQMMAGPWSSANPATNGCTCDALASMLRIYLQSSFVYSAQGRHQLPGAAESGDQCLPLTRRSDINLFSDNSLDGTIYKDTQRTSAINTHNTARSL